MPALLDYAALSDRDIVLHGEQWFCTADGHVEVDIERPDRIRQTYRNCLQNAPSSS